MGRKLRQVTYVVTVCAIAGLSAQNWGPPDGYGLEHSRKSDGYEFCLLKYRSNRSEKDGNGWRTDFPQIGWNFTTRVKEITTIGIADKKQVVVDVGSPDLFLCPFTFASDVGTISLSPDEARNLQRYLEKGGFLWVDDFWGWTSWSQWMAAVDTVAPFGSRLVTPDLDHPLFHILHFMETGSFQVSNIGIWSSQGTVSERGEDSPETPLQVLVDRDDRIVIVMTHNSDIGDTWEQEGGNPEYFLTYSVPGYGLGVNVLLYAMTH